MVLLEDAAACPAGAYQKTILVGGGEADAFGRMSPEALALHIGDATAEHMAALGVDARALQSHGLLWVLARTALKVFRLPAKGERVLLRTWAGVEKFWMYPRRTLLFSMAGEKLVGACSQWMLIGADSRKLVPPSELMRAVPVLSLPDEPGAPAPRMPFPAELDKRAERVVQPREIDLNGHMNNSRYLNWSMDLLDAEYLRGHSLGFLWVEYCMELFAGQRASIWYKQEKDALFTRGYVDGEDSFSLKMKFCPLL